MHSPSDPDPFPVDNTFRLFMPTQGESFISRLKRPPHRFRFYLGVGESTSTDCRRAASERVHTPIPMISCPRIRRSSGLGLLRWYPGSVHIASKTGKLPLLIPANNRDRCRPNATAVPENLVLNHFFFLETSTGVSVSRVSRVSGWDPSGFPEKMGYHEFTGAGVAGGSLRGSLRGLTDSSLFSPTCCPTLIVGQEPYLIV